MKKKPVLWIVLGVVVVAVIGIAVWGKQYYDDHYVGSDYYAMIPLDYDMTPQPLYDNHGEQRDTGKIYDIMAYNDQGDARKAEFTVSGKESSDFPQPGAYLCISISKELVVGWGYAQESDVPAKAMEKIQAS